MKTLRAAILVVTMAGLGGCATTGQEAPRLTTHEVCLVLKNWTKEQIAQLQREARGALTNEFLKDYVRLRDQIRACQARNR